MANYKVVDADQLDADLTAVADAIREKTGGTETMGLEQMPERIGEINGAPSWLPYIVNFQAAFKAAVFPENSELTLEVPSASSTLMETFQETKNLAGVKLIGSGTGDYLQMQGAFRYNYYLKWVDLSEFDFAVSDWYMAFNSCIALEEIIGELSDIGMYTNNFTNCFGGCVNLREVRFVQGAIFKGCTFSNSQNLSDASIQSILDGLADLTGGTAQTLTLHATVGAKLTDEQKAAVAAKNWTLAY